MVVNCCGGIARFTRVLFELPCYPQFELEIHIVGVSYFTSNLVSGGQFYFTEYSKIHTFFIFLISKFHIIFGYFVVENGARFPWTTNQEPLFSFMHGRVSDSVASYNYPSRYIVCTRFM